MEGTQSARDKAIQVISSATEPVTTVSYRFEFSTALNSSTSFLLPKIPSLPMLSFDTYANTLCSQLPSVP